jgi:hypothetical protein
MHSETHLGSPSHRSHIAAVLPSKGMRTAPYGHSSTQSSHPSHWASSTRTIPRSPLRLIASVGQTSMQGAPSQLTHATGTLTPEVCTRTIRIRDVEGEKTPALENEHASSQAMQAVHKPGSMVKAAGIQSSLRSWCSCRARHSLRPAPLVNGPLPASLEALLHSGKDTMPLSTSPRSHHCYKHNLGSIPAKLEFLF